MKEPLLLTLCTATAAVAEELKAENGDSDTDADSTPLRGKANTKPDLGPTMKLDTELYEGIVSQPIIEPTVRRLRFSRDTKTTPSLTSYSAKYKKCENESKPNDPDF